MKLHIGKQLIKKVADKVMSIHSMEDIINFAKNVQNIEEVVVEMAFSYYNKNKKTIENKLNNISEDDLQKAHDILTKTLLAYTPKWDAELNLTIIFEKEETL